MGSWKASEHVFPRKWNFAGALRSPFDFAKNHPNFFLVQITLEFSPTASLPLNPSQLHLKNHKYQWLSRTNLSELLYPFNSAPATFEYFWLTDLQALFLETRIAYLRLKRGTFPQFPP